MTCQTCHNLHGTNHQPGFLRISPEKLCQTCHFSLTEKMTGNLHDPQSFGGHWPVNINVDQSCNSCHQQIHTWDQSRQMSRCGLCHQMHSWDNDQNLWTFTPDSQEMFTREDICTTCHNDITWAYVQSRPPVKSVIHPRHPSNPSNTDSEDLLCQTCHDPHAPPEAPFMLNIAPETPSSELCYECHQNVRSVEMTLHDPRNLNADNRNPACAPCHSVHANYDLSTELFRLPPPGSLNKTPTENLCLGCHENSDANKNITFVEHPEPFLTTGAVQLWSIFQVAPVSHDRISCTTCHLPHGRDTVFPAGLLDLSPEIRKAQISALKLLQLPNVAQTLCFQCHGDDSGKLFLYYHYPEKRHNNRLLPVSEN